jgi:hypothetical protein
LSFKIITVEWDMPGYKAITITDFPPSWSLITFNFISRSNLGVSSY